jgi:adenylate cyclase
MDRKRAAVVFNDIQGYTSLMQENESYAVQIRQRHKEVVDRLTREFKGTVIQYYGDGTLTIFEHTIDAVQCALHMQKEFLSPPIVPLRIGINAGDVLLGPDGVYGDSVNIASRIERMSVPGSVLISECVFDEIKNVDGIRTKDLGQFELKNVRHPVSLHALIADDIAVPDPVELSGKRGFKIKSILVLPFFNLSRDPENEHFSDEITEQVIAALSQIEGLRVISRTSSFTFKDKAVNLRQIHHELGVDNVLEGSVRKHGNKVRITAQLVNAADDFQLWSETYHREITDLFQIQDEIAAMISNKLKASFIENAFLQKEEDDRPPQEDAAAMFRQGMYHWKKMQPGFIDLSMDAYRRALELDMNFFPAWPSLATAYAFKAFNNQMPSVTAAKCCKDSLDEACRLNPDHSRTHAAHGLYHLFFTWDWKEAAHHIRLALQHQDSDQFFYQASIQHIAGIYHMASRRFEEAIAVFKKGLKMDPLNVPIQLELARAFLYKMDYSGSTNAVNQVLRTMPESTVVQEALGWIYFNMGQQRKGIEAFEKARTNTALTITGMAGLAYAYARTSQTEEALKTKELLISFYQDLPDFSPHYSLALAHLGALEYKDMFRQLTLAAEAKMPILIYLEANPIWDEIKRFPEYGILQQKIFGAGQRPPL